MDSSRKAAIIVGVLILLAYSMLGSGNPDAKMMGMFLEAISGAAVIGISIIMFPLFKPYNKNLTLGYIFFRIIEGSFMIITGLLFLSHNAQLLAIRDGIWVGHAWVLIAVELNPLTINHSASTTSLVIIGRRRNIIKGIMFATSSKFTINNNMEAIIPQPDNHLGIISDIYSR